MNKQNRNKLIDTENRMKAVREEEGWGLSEIGGGIKQKKTTHRHRQQYSDHQRERGRGQGEEGKQGLNGDGRKLDFG